MPLLSTIGNASARGYGLAGIGLASAPTIGNATATGTTTATVQYFAPLVDGGSPIISYTAVSSGGQTATVYQSGSGTITVSGLSQSTNYAFYVYATNALGNSPNSGMSNVIQTFGVPNAPTIGTASVASNTSATVSYSAPGYDGGSTITSYVAVATPGGQTGSVSQSGSGSITVSGLSLSTTYQFRVYANNAYGSSAYSGFSNSITMPSPFYINVSPTAGSVTIPKQSAPVVSQGSFTVTGTSGSGTITVQEIQRPTPASTSISPSVFFLSAGGSRGVTVTCTSPDGYYGLDNVYTYGFAILGSDTDAPSYPTYYFYQNRV